MKKTLTILSFMGLASFSANAQWCNAVAAETPNTSATEILTPSSANIPCATQGVPYNEVITFKVPHLNVPSPVGDVDVDSLEWVSISNLPCGLCWKIDRPSKLYGHDNYGVITISGTTNDAVGQYDLYMLVKAKLVDENSWEEAQDASLANISLSIRVQAAGDLCTAYNPNNPNTNNASCVTPVGISEVNNYIHAVSVTPNPVNTTATVTFESKKTENYTLSVTDILGKQVLSKTIKAVAGNNAVTIERNNIPQGIYFVNITDGKSVAVQKFVIAD